MMRYIYFIVFNAIGFSLIAQNTNPSKSFSNGLGAVDYSFNVGSEVGSTFKDSYYFSHYFSPNAQFDVTKKFSLVVGIGARYTQMNNMPVYTSEFNTQPMNDVNITSLYTYASGIYKLNSKVNLNATVLFEDATFNSPQAPMTMNNQYKDMSFGVNYNVTKHITINAQMHMSDRPYNLNNQNNMRYGRYSPFMNAPIY